MEVGESVATWERIAESFSETRNRPWDQVADFLETLPDDATLLDVACGNGRHGIIARKKGMQVIGVDASLELAGIAQERLREAGEGDPRAGHVLGGSAVNLPLARNSVDHALFIAALHNIPGRDRRVQALRELRRVLRPRGMALVTVWARWQDRFADHYAKELVRHLPRKLRLGEDAPEFGDILIPWRGEEMRFYHLMSLRETILTCKEAGFFVKDAWSEKLASQWLPDNHFVVAEKPPSVERRD
jgi:ubiquinone/menaquinone biosynthesis C-methylase UbiE